MTIGEGGDRQIVEKCINGMATRISNEILKFMQRNEVEAIDEVVFTGGGTNIPRITLGVAESLVDKGVKTFHSSRLPENATVNSVNLNQQVVRGSSALGGASVLFGDEE